MVVCLTQANHDKDQAEDDDGGYDISSPWRTPKHQGIDADDTAVQGPDEQNCTYQEHFNFPASPKGGAALSSSSPSSLHYFPSPVSPTSPARSRHGHAGADLSSSLSPLASSSSSPWQPLSPSSSNEVQVLLSLDQTLEYVMVSENHSCNKPKGHY